MSRKKSNERATATDELKSPQTESTRRRFYLYSRRTIWIFTLCLLGVLVAGLLLWNERQKRARQTAPASNAGMEREELAGANLARIPAQMYFHQAGARALLAVQRDIFAADAPQVRARQLVAALVEGPQAEESEKVVAVLPKETKVRQIYLLKDGTAVVDLSEEVASLLPGGIESEAAAMESIQRTLVENVKEIRAVRFLVNGKDTETFAGHIALQAGH